MIDACLKKIDEGLRSVLDEANRRYRLKTVSDALFRCSREFVLRKGKRLRPLLFILSYKGYCRKNPSPDKKLYRAAAALELLHDFMLIHDDVIDNSNLRRGKPTLHKVFDSKIRPADSARLGQELAIVAGDIIFALGIEAFLAVEEEKSRKEKALKKLVETAAFTGAGEFIDVVFGHENIETLSEEKIFLNYRLKTAKYTFECPLLLGAILAGADDRERKLLSRLGMAAGKAFQIYDDLLDMFAAQKVIGKPTLTDLTESKKTLLVFTAHRLLKGRAKRRFKNILEKTDKDKKDLQEFRRMVVQSGSYAYCVQKMNSLQRQALRSLKDLHMKKNFKKMLGTIIPRPRDGELRMPGRINR